MKKTALEWFNELPEPYKSQAIENATNYSHSDDVDSEITLSMQHYFMSEAITSSIHWSITPQGHQYWNDLYDEYIISEKPERERVMEEKERDFREQRAREIIEYQQRQDNLVTMSESMRQMLRTLEDKSKVASYLITHSDKRLFCNYVTMRGAMTSYLPNGREHKVNDEGRWARDGRQEMKPAKLARKILPESLKLVESDFEHYNNLVKSYIGLNGDEDGDGRNISVKVVSGEDIRRYYYEGNYSEHADHGSNLWGSCMRYASCEDYFDLFVDNDNIKMLVALDSDSKVVGRALLWECTNGRKAMDTIYAPDSIRPIFISWAVDNDYYYKSDQSCHHRFFNMYRGSMVADWYGTVKINHAYYDYYPYMDTMMYLDTKCKTLTNDDNDGHDKTLRCTDGSHEGNGTVYDDYSNCDIDEDDAVYLDYHVGDVNWSGYTHVDNTVETRFGYRILEDHAVEVGNDYYPEGHDDIVYVETHGCHYHVDDTVETEDGDYIHEDDAVECGFDGLVYHKDDMTNCNGTMVHNDNLESYYERLNNKENV